MLGQRGRGKAVWQVSDAVRSLRHRLAKLLGPEPRDADGQIGFTHRLSLELD